ncbi:membrane protein of unknown function [Nitrosotalea devaniterrae]|uniref:Uncharacterized protein n=1 Tax=Nitrosotalea devaniterrae TaxID=1078905 RepID=A0A128A235_9ARCH|nr:membrane protein of unknown function [Candidatus Nitrosotalea devanaterra]
MNTLSYSIAILSIIFVLVAIDMPLANADCNYCWIPTENNNTAMRILIQSEPDSLNLIPPQDRQIHLKFFDVNTNHLIENVTFAMYVTKGNQTFLQNTFWTKSGSFTLNLQPGNRYLWTANPDHDPINGLYYSKGDQIDIWTSYLTKDVYHFSTQPVVIDFNDLRQQNVGGKFETDLNLLDTYNKTLTSNTITGSSMDPAQPAHNFNVQYRIFNGTGTFQIHDYSFTANTYSKTNGTFEIKIPRNFPYYNGRDGPSNAETYVVIENGGQLTPREYNKTTSDCFFTYSVPFRMNSTIIVLSTDALSLMTPIYGDKVPDYCMSETMIPEFPFAVPMLFAGFTSLIAFYRLKIV